MCKFPKNIFQSFQIRVFFDKMKISFAFWLCLTSSFLVANGGPTKEIIGDTFDIHNRAYAFAWPDLMERYFSVLENAHKPFELPIVIHCDENGLTNTYDRHCVDMLQQVDKIVAEWWLYLNRTLPIVPRLFQTSDRKLYQSYKYRVELDFVDTEQKHRLIGRPNCVFAETTMAHASSGYIHYNLQHGQQLFFDMPDSSETYERRVQKHETGSCFYTLTVHEFGHVLGLGHAKEKETDSIMQGWYQIHKWQPSHRDYNDLFDLYKEAARRRAISLRSLEKNRKQVEKNERKTERVPETPRTNTTKPKVVVSNEDEEKKEEREDNFKRYWIERIGTYLYKNFLLKMENNL